MKKIFLLAAVAMTVAAFVSCEKDDGKNSDNGNEGTVPEVKMRIKSYSLVGDGWADVYQYSYNADGKVNQVFREETKQWNFAYDGDKITVTDYQDATVYEMTLGASGYVESMVIPAGLDGEGEYAYTYNSDGRMTKVTMNGNVTSNTEIQDGCMTGWSRFENGPEEYKVQTFTSTPNTYDIHNVFCEKQSGLSQWLMETGLFGKGSAYLVETSKWANSDATASYTYDFDENGAVTAEHKDYPDWPEEFEYSWEVAE